MFRALGGDGYTPLWADRWPLERLLREKEEIGSLVFAQEYQNEPVSEETAFFRREWIEKCFSPAERMMDFYRGNMPVFTGWDLAVAADRERAEAHDTDYTVGITLALGDDGTRHVLDIYRERGLTPSQVLDVITSKAASFMPAVITLENNLFQSLYEHHLISTTDLPIVGHTTGREKMDVYKGVPSLSVLFEKGKYRLPCGDEHSQAMTTILANELVGLGVETHDDTVMALWIAECAVRRFRDRENTVQVIDDPTW